MADTFELVVQLNGKLVDRIQAPAGDRRGRAGAARARISEKLAGRLDGKEVVKTIVVPGRLVNVVAK